MSQDKPLRAGNVVDLLPTHNVYAGNYGHGHVTTIGNWAGRYVVTRTLTTGGGTGHGAHDVFPDGHLVFATRIGNFTPPTL